jgi:hypothetical protein
MTDNPLLQKYEEIYGKKEEPVVEEKYEMPPEWDVRSVTTSNNPYINTKSNHIPITKLTSYDPYSGEDSFLQIAEKVKNKDARVTSVTLNRDAVGGIFSTGLTTITFEVQVWDTP